MSKKSRDRKRAQRKKQEVELQAFKVQLTCGCCDETVYFKDEEAIKAAFAKAGLGRRDITDEKGNTVEDVDTFYGYRAVDEPRRGLGYLAGKALDTLKGGEEDEANG